MIGKVISFVHVVLLIRLITQAEFGLYSLIWAHLGLLVAWQDLGTTSFGMLQGKYKNKLLIFNNLLSLRLLLALIVAIFTVALAFFFNYSPSIILLIISFISLYLSNAVSGYLLIISSLKRNLYLPTLYSTVFDAVRVVISLSVLYFTKNLYLTLYTISAGYFIYALILLFIINKKFITYTWQFNRKVIKHILRSSLVFSLISFFATVYFRADFIILERLKGGETLALYSAAYKFFEVALILIPSYNFSSVPTFKILYNTDRTAYRSKIVSDSVFLLAISSIVIAATLLLGKPIISIFFSKNYLPALPLLNTLIFSLPFLLLISVFLNALYAQRKEWLIVGLFFFQMIFNIGANLYFVPQYGAYASSIITVMGEGINMALLGCYLFYTLKNA